MESSHSHYVPIMRNVPIMRIRAEGLDEYTEVQYIGVHAPYTNK